MHRTNTLAWAVSVYSVSLRLSQAVAAVIKLSNDAAGNRG